MTLKPTIGLEIHIELATQSKMFCQCKNDPDETEPNKNICPICTAQPGSLPVINQEAVKKIIKTALALNCQINTQTFFERKNYFYPDLPKGYQISQYKVPLSKKGFLKLSDNKKICIERVHLEEDTAKLLHSDDKDFSLVDFNRAGVPLMELVTEPNIESAAGACQFIKELQMILRYLGVSEANMEKGQMRAEVNISLIGKNKNSRTFANKISKDSRVLGTKVEIKNLNSIRAVDKAIEYEIKRQTEILEKGGKVIQETRGWHDAKQITFSQREKEQAHDYRYFPEPDLPVLDFSQEFISGIKKEISALELPFQKKARFKQEYGLSDKEIGLYLNRQGLAEFFEKTMSELREWVSSEREGFVEEEEFKRLAKVASNYLCSDLLGLVRDLSGSDAAHLFTGLERDIKVSPENFAEFIKIIYNNEISSKIAKIVLSEMLGTGADPSQIIESRGLKQITDDLEIETIIKQVITDNPKPIEDFKKGKKEALQFLAGKVMAQTKGKANPQKVQQILKKLL